MRVIGGDACSQLLREARKGREEAWKGGRGKEEELGDTEG